MSDEITNNPFDRLNENGQIVDKEIDHMILLWGTISLGNLFINLKYLE